MNKIISMASLLLFAFGGARAQSIAPSVINTAGGSATLGGSVFEWSIGEMALVSTFTSGSVIVTQGVLQPSDLPLNASLPTTTLKNLSVYPNPTSDLVNIEYVATTDGNLACRLFDVAGREIMNRQIAVVKGHASGQLDLSSLAAASYFLEVKLVTGNYAVESTTCKIQLVR